jgi:Kelch motif protein/galactose oxidase-like protein
MFSKRVIRTALVLAVALAALAGAAVANAASSWWTAAPMQGSRYGHTANLLANGKVLVAGGYDNNAGQFLSGAELYDPSTNIWSATGALTNARRGGSSVTLSGGSDAGKVLVAGGFGDLGDLVSTEIYDPATGQWSTSGDMTTPRQEATMTDLGFGQVLIAGGLDANFNATNKSEIWSFGSWSPAGDMVTARADATATRLKDGRILVVGGNDGSFSLQSAEIFDPDLGTWSPAAPPSTPRENHTATLLPDGRVLVAGGESVVDTPNPADAQTILDTTEIYNPVADTWTAGPPMPSARRYATATLTADGTVLVAGGVAGTPDSLFVPAEASLYDPVANAWTSAGAQNGSSLATATVLQDGRVLLAGGGGPRGSGPSTNVVEWFRPASVAPSKTTVSVTPPHVDSVRVGTTSVTGFATVLNTGSAFPMIVDGATISGPDAAQYSVVSNTCPSKGVAPGESCLVGVNFTPASEGTKDATLAIQVNNAAGSATVPLTAAGLSANVGIPGITTTTPTPGTGKGKDDGTAKVGDNSKGRGADDLHFGFRVEKHHGKSVVHLTVTYLKGTKGVLKAKLTRGKKVVARWTGSAKAGGRSILDLKPGHELSAGKYVLTVTLANGSVITKTIRIR